MSTDAPRLLVVDDEPAQMTALCNTLRDQGYEPLGFTSARDSLASLQERPCELLLTDLRMSEIDGIALLRAALEIDPQIVGIVMTGEGTIASAVEAMRAGAFDYILKPFRLSGILPVLQRALAVRRLRVDNARLQRYVEERTAELEVSNRELAAANKALAAFSSSVSHDLRAPLRAISGFTQILLEEHAAALPEEALQLLHKVSAGGERMHSLIDGLLRLAQLGRQPLEKRPVQLAALAREVLRDLGGQLAGRDIDVRIAELPACVADAALMRQVLVNLLSNALKFTRHRQPAVVELGSVNQRGDTVYFVRDNGAGFDMVHAERLFEAFTRLHRPAEFEGTGIGLSIVQRIIERHGGRIWADARPGQGATFYFALPPD